MVAVGAVIEHAKTGKILLVQRSRALDWQGGEWEIGYGRIDQFEDPIVGLKRETKEEVGITDLHVGQVLSVWHIYRGPQTAENDLIGITYHCTTTTDQVTISDEHEAYQWIDASQALELITIEGIRRDVQAFIDMKQKLKHRIGKEVIGVGAGALIFNTEGKFLITLRGKKAKNEVGTWEIPGGAVEFGETITSALMREIKEELDIDIEVGEMLQLCDHIIESEHQHWVSPTYICTLKHGTPRITEPEKCEEIRWVTPKEALRLPLSIVTQQDVHVLLEQRSTTQK